MLEITILGHLYAIELVRFIFIFCTYFMMRKNIKCNGTCVPNVT